MFFRRNTSAVQVAYPVAHFKIGVDGDHTYLAAEVLGNLFDQFRIAQGCRVDGNLIGSGTQQAVHIFQLVDAAANCERDADIGRNLLYQFRKCLTPFVRSSYIQIYQFVCSLPAVLCTQFDRVAGIAEVYEIDSLNGFSIFYVQTGYYSLGKHI